MEFKPIHKFNKNDKPVILNDKQIERVLNLIPEPMGATEEVKNLLKLQIHDFIRQKLKITPISPSIIKEFVYNLIRKYDNASIIPGAPIGIAASEALGATATQTTLDTFHKSGSKENTISAIDVITNLIKYRKTQSDPKTHVYFNYNINDKELEMMRIELEMASFESLIINKEIKEIKSNELEEWKLFYKIPKNSYHFLRITLSSKDLYHHNLTNNDIALLFKLGSLRNFNIDKQNIFFSQFFTIIPSPTHLSFIDIYYKYNEEDEEENNFLSFDLFNDDDDDEKKSKLITKEVVEPLEFYYFSKVIIENLNTIIKGVKDANFMEKKSHKLIDMIKDVRDNKFIMNKNLLFKIPFNEKDFKEYLKTKNIKGLNLSEDKLFYEFKSNEKITMNDIKKWNDENDSYKINYLLSSGDRILDFLLQPGVSHEYSFSNNIRTNNLYYGIDNARNNIITELFNIISQTGSSVNPIHIELLAESMTTRGIVGGSTSAGLSAKETNGPLTLGSFEYTKKYFISHALTGRTDETSKNIVTSLIHGQNILMGTNYSYVALDSNNKTYYDTDTFNIYIDDVKNKLNVDYDIIELVISLEKIDEMKNQSLEKYHKKLNLLFKKDDENNLIKQINKSISDSENGIKF